MRRHPDEFGLAGGQGRDADEILKSVSVLEFLLLVLLTAICVLILGGCARPSTYVEPSIDATPEERDSGDTPDRPHWEELRQNFGGL